MYCAVSTASSGWSRPRTPSQPVGGRALVEPSGRSPGSVVGVRADPAGVAVGGDPEPVVPGIDRVLGATRPAQEVAVVRGRTGVGQTAQVVELEPELGHEGAERVVHGVDELAAVLGRLAVGPAARGPAAASEPVGVGLVDRAGDAAPGQLVGAREPREPGADDGDAGCRYGRAGRHASTPDGHCGCQARHTEARRARPSGAGGPAVGTRGARCSAPRQGTGQIHPVGAVCQASPMRGPTPKDVLAHVTLVTGKEEFLSERTVVGVREAVRRHDHEAEISETQASGLTLAQLGEMAAPSLFSSTRCVVVRGLENLPEESVDGLLAYAGVAGRRRRAGARARRRDRRARAS